MDKKLKIVFVGTPDMAPVCLDKLTDKGFNIVCAIPPKKTHETYNFFKGFVEYKNIKLEDFKDDINEADFIEKIKNYNADIGVVCSYDLKLKKDFLKTTRLGYLNAHPSKLPQYRGAMPYFHIIKNGEKKSGVTIHFIDEDYDTGDIVFQKEFDILPFETTGTLFSRTNYMLADMLCEVLSDIEQNKEIKRIKQPDGEYKKAPKVENSIKIDWSKSIYEIDCLIRACNPFFNAMTTFRGVDMKILKATPIEHSDNGAKSGSIVRTSANCTLVAAKDGYISLDMVNLGNWGNFGAKEFFFTFTPKENEFLE